MCYASSLEHFVVVWSIPSLPSLLPPSLPPSCPLPSSPPPPPPPPVSLPLPSPRLPHTLQAHTPAELGPATPKGSHARVPSDAAHRLCSACRQTPRTPTAPHGVPETPLQPPCPPADERCRPQLTALSARETAAHAARGTSCCSGARDAATPHCPLAANAAGAERYAAANARRMAVAGAQQIGGLVCVGQQLQLTVWCHCVIVLLLSHSAGTELLLRSSCCWWWWSVSAAWHVLPATGAAAVTLAAATATAAISPTPLPPCPVHADSTPQRTY